MRLPPARRRENLAAAPWRRADKTWGRLAAEIELRRAGAPAISWRSAQLCLRPSAARIREAFRFLEAHRALWPDEGWEEIAPIIEEYKRIVEVSHEQMSDALLLLYGALFSEGSFAEVREIWSAALAADGCALGNPTEPLRKIMRSFAKEPVRFGIVCLPPALRNMIVPILFEFLSKVGEEATPANFFIEGVTPRNIEALHRRTLSIELSCALHRGSQTVRSPEYL